MLDALYYKYSLLIIALTIVVGCSKQSNFPTTQKSLLHGSIDLVEPDYFSKQTLTDRIEQAKQLDIPVPIDFHLIAKKTSQTNEYFMYQGSSMSLHNVCTFYLHEMERLGWNIFDVSNDVEGLLFCQKVNKECALSIRPQSNNIILIHIFLKPLPPTLIDNNNEVNILSWKGPYNDTLYT